MAIHEITACNEVMVEDWSEGLCHGMREANDAEAWLAIVSMVRELQEEVADLKSRLCTMTRGL